jgi:hypothetical protein
MNSEALGLIAFVVIFGGAVGGVAAGRRMPEHHLSEDTRNAVALSMAVVGTLAALVLGLLISTASNTFTARSDAVAALSVNIIRLDRSLARYGSDAAVLRQELKTYAHTKVEELFPTRLNHHATNSDTLRLLERAEDGILALQPTNDRERWLKAQSLGLADDIADARWLLVQKEGTELPTAFLALLIFWLAILFGSFGIFSPRTTAPVVALFLCSIAVSGGIYMILEMGSPHADMVQLPLRALENALKAIGK